MAGNRELDKYLKQLSREELIAEVNKLYKRFKLVKEYYTSELGLDKGELLKKYKERMQKLFVPKGNILKPDVAASNKLINEFSTISVHPVDVIDLMLYKVELCLDFLEEWGLDFTGVANTVANTYPQILQMIYYNALEENFRERCESVEGIGLNYSLIKDTLQ